MEGRTYCSVPFYIWDLSIHEFCYPWWGQRVLKPIPCREATVVKFWGSQSYTWFSAAWAWVPLTPVCLRVNCIIKREIISYADLTSSDERKPLRGTQAFQKEGLSLQVWWSRSYVKETHMTNCRQPLGTSGLYDLRVATSQPSAKFLGPQSHKHKEINSANTLNNLRSDSSQSSLQILRKPIQYFNFDLTRPKSGDQVKPGSDFWPTQTMKLWYLSC